MTPDLPPNPSSGPEGQPHRRRKRYPGRYPRRPDQRYKELAPDQFPGIHDHVRAQGRTPAGTHVPVLVAEVLETLRPQAGETVVNCTVGYGGHAAELLKRIGPTGRLLGLDVDEVALQRTRERLAAATGGAAVSLRRGNFAGIDRAMAAEGLAACNVILADLGLSSMQIDDPARGFSYKFDGPLDMRMDARLPHTAADLLRTLPEAEFAAMLFELGDEPAHAAIARAIIEARRRRPIARTLELVQLILEAKGLSRRHWRRQAAAETPRGGSPHPPRKCADLHPAALTFQALRIRVNDELGALHQFLRVVPMCLRPGGRIAVITFHSGEDRLVKQAFREGVRTDVYSATNDEVIRPGPQERTANPRSASAKLRWAMKA